MKHFITTAIPVFNDAVSLKTAIPKSIEILEKFGREFEIIIAEDESTDGSREIALEWEKKDSRVHLLHSDKRQGKGMALNKSIEAAKGDIFCFYDVDLATDINQLPELLLRIENGADISIGSRLMKNSSIKRSCNREITSRGYNFLVRSLLGSKLYDHQCGFKACKTEVLKELVKEIRAHQWFWDTELLVLAQLEGLKIEEFPVNWTQGSNTTIKFKDIKGMAADILKMRRRMKSIKKMQPR